MTGHPIAQYSGGRHPDLVGAGKGWVLAMNFERAPACLAAWLIDRPDAHPAWRYYAASLVHLREVPGQDPPFKMHPNASHEITMFALSPEHAPDPDAPPFAFLTPPNIVFQMHSRTDDQAKAIFRDYCRALVIGTLNPDTDFQRQQNMWLGHKVDAIASLN